MKVIEPQFIPGAKIKVIWVWWAWTNSVNRMMSEWVDWVEFICINTDAQALALSTAPTKINIWLNITRGLWAWANPEIGRKAAEESMEDIKKLLEDTDMVFVTCWMWGWTWTWAAPVIAEYAKEMGILTIWVVTKPFSFEWKRRLQNALEGLDRMKKAVDSLIIIPNDRIFSVIDKKTTFRQAFSMVDKVLTLWVQWISDLIVNPGYINVDFADIKVIMQNSWTALLGIGYGEWENSAIEAAKRAIDNPLLESSLDWATSIIFTVTGWEDLSPIEVQEAAKVVEDIADDDVNLIWWMSFDPDLDWEVKVTIIATGFPEATQEAVLKGFAVGDTKTTMTWSSQIITKKPITKSDDFVNRALKSSTITTKEEPKSSNDDDDFDTPSFLKKKL